jgi:hypothetical protein
MGSAEAKALTPESAAFYEHAIAALATAQIAFLVGGAYALEHYTGISRDTKDADVFVRPDHIREALQALSRAGYRTELCFPHWLGKAYYGDDVVDVIFSSGNAIAEVDDAWFDNARTGRVLGREVQVVPAEEMVWSKAFVQERERYDGADIHHVIRATADTLDWDRLVARFGPHWRVLLAHLTLFGFVYPGERDKVPARVLRDLATRLDREADHAVANDRVCQGTLLSREQYLVDLERWGYVDARLRAPSKMTRDDIRIWSADIA